MNLALGNPSPETFINYLSRFAPSPPLLHAGGLNPPGSTGGARAEVHTRRQFFIYQNTSPGVNTGVIFDEPNTRSVIARRRPLSYLFVCRVLLARSAL